MEQNVYSTGEVAASCGIPRWQFLYFIERGLVPGPTSQVPGRRLFTAEDVAKIRDALAALGKTVRADSRT